MIDLSGKTYLVGGVTCTGNDLEKQSCQRTDKIFELRIQDPDKPWDAEWIVSGLKLTQPISSHGVLKVPSSYCNRLPGQ